ncbi:type II toxin-antitoxin system HicB family antitoxin, partial [Candidatus Poribacteria bacterium]|nr:type II toxin-antitoxin system HicB family antitoxin [Candidatus Poribacteria bacterium]
MNYYYATFIQRNGSVEVDFPDLAGCVTFGDTWEEAYENAVDVLAGWLANADQQFVKVPSSREKLEGLAGEIIPVPVDEKIMEHYAVSKRFNVIFPASALVRVDAFRKAKGLKR